MARILALDVGEKTIGTAVSDESETFAFPRVTILRQEGHRRDMASIRAILDAEGIEQIVVGMPLMMSGRRAVQAEKVDAFIETLRRFTHLPIHTQDERLSTAESERALMAAGRRREERKQVVDSVAASVILQSFMEWRSLRRAARGTDSSFPRMRPWSL